MRRTLPKPAVLPSSDHEQCANQMQSLSLNPHHDSPAWDSGPGAHTSAASTTDQQHPDTNQYSAYDYQRDSTTQPISAWQTQEYGYGYYDPSAYEGYEEVQDQEWYGPEAGDDWDQLGFAAEPECQQQADGQAMQSEQHKAQIGHRKPSEQPLCSQFQVSGDCPRGAHCHMAHGDLCEVRLSTPCPVGCQSYEVSFPRITTSD